MGDKKGLSSHAGWDVCIGNRQAIILDDFVRQKQQRTTKQKKRKAEKYKNRLQCPSIVYRPITNSLETEQQLNSSNGIPIQATQTDA